LSSFCDDTTELNEGVEVHLAQFSQFVFNREVIHSNEDLAVLFMVVWIDLRHDFCGDSVQDRQHVHRLFSKPNCKRWLLGSQVGEVNFEGLLVVLAHVLDAVFVNVHALL